MRVTVENFQSLAKAQIDVEGLTAVVGPSDRGKSALVRAIDGCLFNKGGEQFVREGASFTQVALDWPYGNDQRHEVVWTKGGGKNNYQIDGELFDKVGAKVPDALQALGFKAVLIGGRLKEEGGIEGGEWVRPQIAGQFDGIFLLDRPGTFLSEVIVRLSRLSVLQRASRQCVLDLKQTKSQLTVRQGDLTKATTEAEALAKAPQLRMRLNLLLQEERHLGEVADNVSKIRYLVGARQIHRQRAALMLPTPATTTEYVTNLKDQYQQLQNARTAILLRGRLKALPKKLPKAHAPLKPLEVVQLRWLALQDAMGRREMAVTAMMTTQRAVSQAEQYYTAAQHNVKLFMHEHPTCPVCAQPWPQAVGV